MSKNEGKEYSKKYYLENKDKKKAYSIKNKEKIKIYRKEYYKKNKNSILIKRQQYREGNKVKIAKGKAIFFQKNKKNLIKKHLEYKRERKKIDILFKLQDTLRTRLYIALRDNYKSGSAVGDLGCTIPELKIHLEKQFQTGMTWGNYGSYRIENPKVWNIDHSEALANFDLTSRDQLLKACHYTNLKPMWGLENIKKSNKIIWQSQEQMKIV